MTAIKFHNNYSLVTAILPMAKANSILDKSISEFSKTGILLHSRGTLQKEKWYKKLKPAVSPEQTIAFGDNYNDVEMIKGVGMGVAVGNARKEVLEVANIVTQSGKEDGVANSLKELFKINVQD